REQRRVIVLHRDHVPTLFGSEDPIGKQVELKDRSFTVVGVYSHQWNRSNFIPYTTARVLAGNSDTIRRIVVSLRNVHTIDEGTRAEESLRQTLGQAHNFAPDDNTAVWIWNRLNQHLRMTNAMGILQLAVWIIGLLTMLSGIVGVSNIMFVSVRERTHEIGVRRAIGARPAVILRQIMLESVAITTLFGYVGIVLGIAVTSLIGASVPESNPPMLRDPSISITMAVELTAVLVAAGAFAGLFPALKSLKIKPVEALRDE
ncbi:MAG: ABC transporter permease, partial [Duncaniella sp.]|nr:ABC transporter permease [Duncaniella sp.]